MYKLFKSAVTQKIVSVIKANGNDVLIIPFDPDNTDYQAYLEWVAEGNTPEPADE
jgi:hypothetical protein